MRIGRWLLLLFALLLLAAVGVAYVGYVKSYLDDEIQTTFFVKRYPAMKIAFYDPFASEADDIPIDKLSGSDRKEFSDYCKFRFGIVANDNVSLSRCKAAIPSYIK